MSKRMAGVIAAYGIVLLTLSFVVQWAAPAFAKVIFVTGTGGGGLCVLWSIIAAMGHKRRAWAVLTMIAVGVVLLSQVVQAWLGFTGAPPTNLTGRLVPALMLLMTVGMLMYVLHGERTPEYYEPKTIRRDGASSSREDEQHPVGGAQS